MLLLQADGLADWDLDAEVNVTITSVDASFPEIRAVAEPRPGANGTLDETTFLGASSVTLQGWVIAETQPKLQTMDRLRSFMRPRLRPYLTKQEGLEPARRIKLVSDALTGILERPENGEFQVSWKCPDGWWESVELHEAQIFPLDAISTPPSGGVDFPVDFPMEWPATGQPAVEVMNNGNDDATWVAQIVGPLEDPVLTHADSGLQLVFAGLTIAGGDYLQLDSAAKTVLLNGSPGSSRYGFLDFSLSTWFQLAPGGNSIRISGEDSSATVASVVNFFWRDHFVGG